MVCQHLFCKGRFLLLLCWYYPPLGSETTGAQRGNIFPRMVQQIN